MLILTQTLRHRGFNCGIFFTTLPVVCMPWLILKSAVLHLSEAFFFLFSTRLLIGERQVRLILLWVRKSVPGRVPYGFIKHAFCLVLGFNQRVRFFNSSSVTLTPALLPLHCGSWAENFPTVRTEEEVVRSHSEWSPPRWLVDMEDGRGNHRKVQTPVDPLGANSNLFRLVPNYAAFKSHSWTWANTCASCLSQGGSRQYPEWICAYENFVVKW